MSKQPHVWFVEQQAWSGRWLTTAPAYFHECDAKNEFKMRSEQRPYQQYRVAKYVRVEPKKKRIKP